MTADLFMLGLANLLPFTMFDYSLPAPLSQLSSLATWMFSDNEEERERAYFGNLPTALAPLSELIPVAMRAPADVFGHLLKRDGQIVSDYMLWSAFPFGRLGRDLKRSFEEPGKALDLLTGIPMHRIEWIANKELTGKPDYY